MKRWERAAVSFASDPQGSLSAVQQDFIGLQDTRLIGRRVVELCKFVKAGVSQIQQDEFVWPPFRGESIKYHPGE